MSLHNEVRSMNGPTKLCLIAAALTGLASCGGSTQQAAVTASLISDGAGEKIMSSGPESGPPTKVVGVPGGTGAVVALFPDGRAFYSPDGFNLGGGGSTVSANGSNNLKVVDIRAVGTGVDALFSGGTAYFSPDGMNLGGGGSTVRAYAGTAII